MRRALKSLPTQPFNHSVLYLAVAASAETSLLLWLLKASLVQCAEKHWTSPSTGQAPAHMLPGEAEPGQPSSAAPHSSCTGPGKVQDVHSKWSCLKVMSCSNTCTRAQTFGDNSAFPGQGIPALSTRCLPHSPHFPQLLLFLHLTFRRQHCPKDGHKD